MSLFYIGTFSSRNISNQEYLNDNSLLYHCTTEHVCLKPLKTLNTRYHIIFILARSLKWSFDSITIDGYFEKDLSKRLKNNESNSHKESWVWQNLLWSMWFCEEILTKHLLFFYSMLRTCQLLVMRWMGFKVSKEG